MEAFLFEWINVEWMNQSIIIIIINHSEAPSKRRKKQELTAHACVPYRTYVYYLLYIPYYGDNIIYRLSIGFCDDLFGQRSSYRAQCSCCHRQCRSYRCSFLSWRHLAHYGTEIKLYRYCYSKSTEPTTTTTATGRRRKAISNININSSNSSSSINSIN